MRELVIPERRAKIQGERRRRLLERFGGCCAACGESIDGSWIADHVIALELGGSNADANLQPLCAAPCNKTKTANDARLIAKAKRLRAGPKVSRHRIRSRGFQACHRPIQSRPFTKRPT
jgi:5-methylcytosine-specific restriction endonuclease McrA